jgi:NAD(P)-dependent dehydrogenase (short-subunit alcohol dehydrogenase family)
MAAMSTEPISTSTQRLNGRVAAITGGASGIGRASALRFLGEGALVVVGDLNPANGERFLADAADLGFGPDRVRFTLVNVAIEDDVAAMVAFAVETFGGLDVMFNNAGIGGAFGPITEVTVDDWDETFHVLVRGVFLGIKHAARQLIAQGRGGSIINTASVAGLTGGGGGVAYSAAKSAVVNLTRAVSIELAAERIRVNAICPGAILTPLIQQGRKSGSLESSLDMFQPWPDGGRPDDIAATAAFLASDDSRFITGEHIVVDGGLTASGASRSGIGSVAPGGWVGMNRGTTGQGATVHRRG